MKKSLHIALASHFGSPIPTEQWQGGKPALAISDASTHYYAKGDEAAIEQEFDGYHGYLYSYEMRLYHRVCIPIRIELADLHVIYVMEGHHDLQLLDAYGERICAIDPHRARYLYLPPANYQLHLVPGEYLIFGFYFDGGIFRQGNERPFEFIKPLIQAYRQQGATPFYSIDFEVGPLTKNHIAYLFNNLKFGQFNNERFVLNNLMELVEISNEKVTSEYQFLTASARLAAKARKLLEQYVSQYGQDFRLAALSEDLNKNISYIKKAFRQEYRLSLSQYKNQLIVEKAKQLLILSTSISETAYDCGYNSLEAFGHFFKRETGMTPSEFLQQADSSIV